MTPRPFYRSRLFWLGLPGVVFLLWGWGLSMVTSSGAEFSGTRNWGIGQFAGDVHAVWNSDGLPDWKRFRTWHFEAPVVRAGESTVPFTVAHQGRPNSYALIPYYAVVLAYVAAWLLTLAWWQRHKSRQLKLHTAP